MKAKAKCPSLDKYDNLPQHIIEKILCLVPIKDAVRTSILSKNWRYKWVTIPKLVFSENDIFDITMFKNEMQELCRRNLPEIDYITKKSLLERNELTKLTLELNEFLKTLTLERDEFSRKLWLERDELSRKLTLEMDESTGKLTLAKEELIRKLTLEMEKLIRTFTLEMYELTMKSTLDLDELTRKITLLGEEISKSQPKEYEFFRKFTLDWEELLGKLKCKMFNAVHQVLLVHKGPIQEFSLSLSNVNDSTCLKIVTCVELDQIITQLARNNDTLKKFTLDLCCESLYRLPLSIFSLHKVTDLSLSRCVFDFNQTFSGFGSLTSLYLESDNVSKKALLHLLSNCPSLKSFTLVSSSNAIDEDITIIELCSCLPVIEYLSLNSWNIQCSAQDRVKELPTALVNLKYFYLNMETPLDDCGLCFVGLVLRSSPNLETFKLKIAFADSDTELLTLENCSDIWLEHLKEFEFENFADRVGEMEFVKLMLVKSPVLKKVRIIYNDKFPKDEELEILRTLSGSYSASPVVKVIVARNPRLGN